MNIHVGTTQACVSCSYRLAQSAVLEGIPKLHKEGIPTKRPDDYFAQMVKSDVHMKKVWSCSPHITHTNVMFTVNVWAIW